jgi:pimeloyl-ACP methyl ester carboxylesterase
LVEPAAGPVLVLLPGSSGDATGWDDLVGRLDPALELFVVRAELRGQGESWPPPAPETGRIETFSDDVVALLDALVIESFYVGGKSIGGMVSVDMLRVCPERILGVISMEGFTHHSVLDDAFGGDMFSTLNQQQQRELSEATERRRQRWTQAHKDEFNEIWKRWERGYEILSHTDKPVLEIWGDRGRERPSRKALQLPERDNIELTWIPGTSHAFISEAPDLSAQLINDFIRRTRQAL